MRFGLQMYGLSKYFREDREGFLKKTSQMGYRFIEPCVSVNVVKGREENFWTISELKEFYPLLESYGFSINSMHFSTQDVLGEIDAIIDVCKSYGIKQVILPTPNEINKETYEEAATTLSKAASILSPEGIDVLIHNGRDNSMTKIAGMCAYEWLLNKCQGTIGAQVDTGWLIYAGIDPESFMWKNEELIESLHYKDFKDGVEVPIGTGLCDMMGCFQFARFEELIQLVDQDTFLDVYKELSDSMNIFRGLSQGRDNTKSILCVMDIESGEVTKLDSFDYIIEAPNWYQQDDRFLFFNSDGYIYKYNIETKESVKLESGNCIHCNNDHVISPDGKEIAVSHADEGWESKIYVFPIEGGSPRLVTRNKPSFLHGWSPDKKELAYCAFRMNEGKMNVDIFAIPYEGGEEVQLTKDAGFNDGPEYSPDGEHILFISTRTGLMQNWVMDRDGSNQKQLTFSERNNWFGHYSPDGKKIVYLSYSKDGLDPNEHLPNMQVQLGLMNADGSDDHVILDFFGGQGSINVNSWNPDSKRFAFVMYELNKKM